jgi:hypothetical protein
MQFKAHSVFRSSVLAQISVVIWPKVVNIYNDFFIRYFSFLIIAQYQAKNLKKYVTVYGGTYYTVRKNWNHATEIPLTNLFIRRPKARLFILLTIIGVSSSLYWWKSILSEKDRRIRRMSVTCMLLIVEIIEFKNFHLDN